MFRTCWENQGNIKYLWIRVFKFHPIENPKAKVFDLKLHFILCVSCQAQEGVMHCSSNFLEFKGNWIGTLGQWWVYGPFDNFGNQTSQNGLDKQRPDTTSLLLPFYLPWIQFSTQTKKKKQFLKMPQICSL